MFRNSFYSGRFLQKSTWLVALTKQQVFICTETGKIMKAQAHVVAIKDKHSHEAVRKDMEADSIT